MPASLDAKQEFTVGNPFNEICYSPSTEFATVFEDDGDTGYFYALDTKKTDNKICDALHVYNVSSVADKDIPSILRIFWSEDGLKSALTINDYPHAIFDFSAKRGYCRTNFPTPDPRWSKFGHEWDESAIDLFK